MSAKLAEITGDQDLVESLKQLEDDVFHVRDDFLTETQTAGFCDIASCSKVEGSDDLETKYLCECTNTNSCGSKVQTPAIEGDWVAPGPG